MKKRNLNLLQQIYRTFILPALLCLISFSVYAQEKNEAIPSNTFKVANELIAKKKFRKAHKILKSELSTHPNDVNLIWLDAQTTSWLGNYKQADRLYNAAMQLAPKNDYLELSYIHSLLDMGKMGHAHYLLTNMETAGKDYSDMARLRAKLYYCLGDYGQASAYLKKAMQLDYDNADANELYDEIALAKAPKISLSTGYLADNQPISLVLSSLKAEQYFNKFLTLYINCDEYHFIQPNTSDAPWVRIGDKLSFPLAGIHINAGGGIFKFPVKDVVQWSGNIDVTKKISRQFDIDLSADRVPYLDARASVDSNISATRYSAMLNWHKSNWLGQVAVLNSMFPENNNVYSAYVWILAPIVHFSGGLLSIGYSSSYGNADKNTYAPVNSISEIVANYGTTPSVAGIYNPYFTPDSMFINSVILSLKLNFSESVSLSLNGDIGYGTAQTPYLYLDKNAAGDLITVKGYSTQSFTPYNGTVSFNYHIDKSWLLNAKYIYHNSYFFTSNYVTVGIEKSFLHREKGMPAEKPTSAFSGMIHDIEGEIQLLYNCTNADELRNSTDKIKRQLTTLRNEQKRARDFSEILPGSERAYRLEERYESLNDMINELNSVDLDDSDEPSASKKIWLVDKQYELTCISYNGIPADE